MSESIDEQIKDAFEIVRKTFSEFGTMMLDFEAELNIQEPKLLSVHTGKGIVTDNSKSLDHSNRWLYPHIARYYSFGGKEISNCFVAAGMIHKKRDYLPIVPKFIMGVILKTDPKEKYKSWWLSSMYSSEINQSREEYAFKNDRNDYKWYEAIPDKDDKNFGKHWYDRGYYCSKKLTEISNRDEVAKLAKEVNNLFSHVKNNY